MSYATMLELGGAGAPADRGGRKTKKESMVVRLIDRVLSFTLDDRGSVPPGMVPPGYRGPLYAAELWAPHPRIVLLTGCKARAEHAYRLQQHNMLTKYAFGQDGSLRDGCCLKDIERAVAKIMGSLVTDGESEEWMKYTPHPVLVSNDLEAIRVALGGGKEDDLMLADVE